MLRVWQEHDRLHRLVEAILTHVADDAHDCSLELRPAELYETAQHVACPRIERARPRLRDDDNSRSVRLVAGVELATGLERDAERAEVVSGHALPSRCGSVALRRVR